MTFNQVFGVGEGGDESAGTVERGEWLVRLGRGSRFTDPHSSGSVDGRPISSWSKGFGCREGQSQSKESRKELSLGM